MIRWNAAAAQVVGAASPRDKTRLTARWARLARAGLLGGFDGTAMPDRPARLPVPVLLPPNRMPKRGKAGSLRGRVALIHALAHIECNAIDLAWDMIGRFGVQFPEQFARDWLKVAADEARHFLMLSRRLRQLGSHYGALPAHDGLWEAAAKSSDDVLARLALVPMVLEARGLDVTPQTMERLQAAGDPVSAELLNIIYLDEIDHVATGTHWFRYVCDQRGLSSDSAFQQLIRTRLNGSLKPPFNAKARKMAGMLPDLYASLASEGGNC